jgi:hypothetical protein
MDAHREEQQVVVRIVALPDAGPEDPHPTVEAAEFFGEAARHQLVLEAPRCGDRRQPDDPGHARQSTSELVRIQERLPRRVVDGDQDDRRLALRHQGAGDELGDLALADHARGCPAEHRRPNIRQLDEHAGGLGRICRGLSLLARVIDDDQVFDHRAVVRGGDPDGARADAEIGRQGKSEEPAVAVLADQVGRHRVGGDPGDEP